MEVEVVRVALQDLTESRHDVGRWREVGLFLFPVSDRSRAEPPPSDLFDLLGKPVQREAMGLPAPLKGKRNPGVPLIVPCTTHTVLRDIPALQVVVQAPRIDRALRAR